MSRFLEALHSGRVLLMDGAMGTELQRAGIKPGECYEAWNLNHADRVAAIHRAYMDAGAQVLLTNTFQASPTALARHNLADRLDDIDRQAIALARSAGSSAFVLGSVGPIAKPDSLDDVIRSLDGADALLLETWSDPPVNHPSTGTALAGVQSVATLTALPVLLSLTYRHQGLEQSVSTQSNRAPEWFAAQAQTLGIAALGVNCGRDIGLDEVIAIVRRYRSETDLPLFARPNAGTPTRDGDRWVYPHTPAQMAERLPELLEAGVSMVGGCCGTTPEHIAAFRPIIAAWNARERSS